MGPTVVPIPHVAVRCRQGEGHAAGSALCADPSDGIELMDLTQLSNALALGVERAEANVVDLTAFWSE